MDRLMVEKARVNSLVRAFVQREAAIGIIGLGYVGADAVRMSIGPHGRRLRH